MSVLKRKRNISKMEFYHNAIKLRLMITEFLLKDFGIKSRRRNLEFAKEVYDITDEDVSEIEQILSAYDMKNSFIDNFPTWLIDKERDYFMDLLRDLMKNICSANTIHITNKEEYYMRRNYQTQAICNCENLLQPVKNNFIRERRKLKRFKNLLDKGLIDFHDIEEQYKSWKGNIKKYDCHKSLRSLDKLFDDLFINNNSQNSH